MESLGNLHDRSYFPPGSHSLLARFPCSDQVLPIVVPASCATLVLWRGDQPPTTDLRPFPAQADPARGRRKESRQVSTPHHALGKNCWKWMLSPRSRSWPASVALVGPACPVRASRRFASRCFHCCGQNWGRLGKGAVAPVHGDKEESLLLGGTETSLRTTTLLAVHAASVY